MTKKLKQMRATVLNELKHIPQGTGPQGEFRMLYWSQRMHSLGRKAEKIKIASEVLQEVLTLIKPDYPDYDFIFDRQFFELKD